VDRGRRAAISVGIAADISTQLIYVSLSARVGRCDMLEKKKTSAKPAVKKAAPAKAASTEKALPAKANKTK